MKTIKLENGEIRNGYEFDELSPELQGKVIDDHIQFELEIMHEDSPYYHCAVEMEKMKTPWFTGEKILEEYKEDIIETIKLNYLFDNEGEILPFKKIYKNLVRSSLRSLIVLFSSCLNQSLLFSTVLLPMSSIVGLSSSVNSG